MADIEAVTVAWVHGDEIAYSWHDSMFRLVMHDIGHEGRVMLGGNIAISYGTGGIVTARNKAVTAFLERDHEWLWWVDTDMGFQPDTVDRLLESADAEERPVVGALCFANKQVSADDMGGFVTLPMPTVYQWGEMDGKQGFVPDVNYARNSMVQAAGTGSACILIHRSVFERIRAEEGDRWYTPMLHPDLGEVSEDLSFCMRIARMGIPLFVNTAVKTTHLKHSWVGEAQFDVFKRNAEGGRSVIAEAAGLEPATPNRAERRRRSKVK